MSKSVIGEFKGKYYFLSNFFSSKIEHEGRVYDNGEAMFHSFKNDNPKYKDSLVGIDPSSAKKFGREVHLRRDWEEVKDECMYITVKAKFTQNQDLKEKLLATGDAMLIEGNTWNDKYWGVCYGKGKNKLGQILMRVREELKEEILKGE